MARKESRQKGNVQLRNGVWTLRYREFDHATCTWQWKRQKLGVFKNRKAALLAADPIMAEVNGRNNGKPPEKSAEMTFRQFVEDRWKAYTMSAEHEPSTRDCYNSLLHRHLLPHLGERQIADIQSTDISRFLEGLQVSAGTLKVIYSVLHVMFDLAQQYELIEVSPVKPKLHRPKGAAVEKPTLDAAQIRAVLAGLPDEQEQLFTLLIAVTGMRVGEALALRWMDFEPERLALAINHTLYRRRLKEPKTKGSRRRIRLVPVIAGLMAAHRERSGFQAGTDFIFCAPDGGPLNPATLRKHLYAAMDAAGIQRVTWKYGFHIFRHTAGTLLYTRSRDLKLVQGTLGHSSISITSDIYVHLDDKVVAEGAEILAAEILGDGDQTVTSQSRMVS